LDEAVLAVGYERIVLFAGDDTSHSVLMIRDFVKRGGHFFSREVRDIAREKECVQTV
jgi:hypothetical protein